MNTAEAVAKYRQTQTELNHVKSKVEDVIREIYILKAYPAITTGQLDGMLNTLKEIRK